MEILACHGLKLKMFSSIDEACKNADKLVAEEKEMMPGLFEKFPDKIVDGFPLLDQFYYVQYQGMGFLIT